MRGPHLVALIVALLGGALVVRALVIGAGSPGGKSYRREDRPVAYWTIIAVATALVIYLLCVAWSG